MGEGGSSVWPRRNADAGGPGTHPGEPFIRVAFDADRIGREVRAGHERVGLVIRPIAVDLEPIWFPSGSA